MSQAIPILGVKSWLSHVHSGHLLRDFRGLAVHYLKDEPGAMGSSREGGFTTPSNGHVAILLASINVGLNWTWLALDGGFSSSNLVRARGRWDGRGKVLYFVICWTSYRNYINEPYIVLSLSVFTNPNSTSSRIKSVPTSSRIIQIIESQLLPACAEGLFAALQPFPTCDACSQPLHE